LIFNTLFLVFIMKISKFGQKIAYQSGIGQLMEDLGEALAKGQDMLMLGGGNPAHIPDVEQHFRSSIVELLADGNQFERAIGNYDPPQGNVEFISAVAGLLRNQLGWAIGPENIALTTGSQSAFFILFNIFAGPYADGTNKKILFPLAPEYIGYCDVGFSDDLFAANRPIIEHIDEHLFKYHIDFEHLSIDDRIGAVCVSRPTNPTGNMLTDLEIEELSRLAGRHDVPLIIDSAYGTPFPNIVFTQAKPFWNEGTIVCMSLSKFGLPALRTGIVIARPEVITLVSQMNAVMNLAPGSMGAALATRLVRTGEILRLSRDVIRPFYQTKAKHALERVVAELSGVDFHVHKPEGAFFLWLWLPGLAITTSQLYERLKKRGVLVVPGHYFFPGLADPWPHKDQCIRVSYSQDDRTFSAGIKLIAEEVKRSLAC